MTEVTDRPELAAEEALRIAQADAAKVYRDLALYRTRLALEQDGWHIDYELKAPTFKGGGPHYVVDAGTGAIIRRRYDQ